VILISSIVFSKIRKTKKKKDRESTEPFHLHRLHPRRGFVEHHPLNHLVVRLLIPVDPFVAADDRIHPLQSGFRKEEKKEGERRGRTKKRKKKKNRIEGWIWKRQLNIEVSWKLF
jgi:hypothetical protein